MISQTMLKRRASTTIASPTSRDKVNHVLTGATAAPIPLLPAAHAGLVFSHVIESFMLSDGEKCAEPPAQDPQAPAGRGRVVLPGIASRRQDWRSRLMRRAVLGCLRPRAFRPPGVCRAKTARMHAAASCTAAKRIA